MRVFCLTFGGSDYASSLYRIFQYQQPVLTHGIELDICPVKEFDWSRDLRNFDAVILQKKLLPIGRTKQLRRSAKRLVYDVDDAIWHPQKGSHHWITNWRIRARLKAIVRAADACLAANSILSSYLLQWNKRVEVLPMALDERIWVEKPQGSVGAKSVRVGWAGKGGNLPYLESIEGALLSAQHDCPQIEYAVYSGQKPNFKELRFTYLPYAPGTEPEAIRTFDLGLLPLAFDKFSEGKSPIKGLQYMAAGIPSIVSPLGATKDMFQDGQTALFAASDPEWSQAITALARDSGQRLKMGKAARCSFEDKNALGRSAAELAQLLKSL